jgi:hypothetical protein
MPSLLGLCGGAGCGEVIGRCVGVVPMSIGKVERFGGGVGRGVGIGRGVGAAPKRGSRDGGDGAGCGRIGPGSGAGDSGTFG